MNQWSHVLFSNANRIKCHCNLTAKKNINEENETALIIMKRNEKKKKLYRKVHSYYNNKESVCTTNEFVVLRQLSPVITSNNS